MGHPGVTELLLAWGNGNADAFDRLMPLVLTELRKVAQNRLRAERPGHVLQPTALVNEAYLRLVDLNQVRWQNRAQFFAVASRLMRVVLVDAARAALADKRGGGALHVTFDEMRVGGQTDQQMVALDEALEALARDDPRKVQVVEMRFFGGLSLQETASVLGVSTDTVTRDWKFAKAWLRDQLGK